jgi:uncharacterized protein YegP (UPF0339 family)
MASKKATIVKGTGSKAKEFRFVLWGSNGRVIAFGEHYTRKANATNCVKRNFPQFKIEDLTK